MSFTVHFVSLAGNGDVDGSAYPLFATDVNGTAHLGNKFFCDAETQSVSIAQG